MTIKYIYFIYGLCVMFYGMMAWFFWHKGREMLSRLAAVLMIVMDIQSLKDLFFIFPEAGATSYQWRIMTSMDMVAVPIYAFILIELCRPGTLKMRSMVLHELPFVILPVLFAIFRSPILYYADVLLAACYGFCFALWTVIEIPRYHRLLKERFSYDENINLNWLSYILISFFAILSLWIVDCLIINFSIEAIYMFGSLVIWIFISYFLYKHESVIDELEPSDGERTSVAMDVDDFGLKDKILFLFEKQQIYLNPQLRLSDVAAMANSNRTYVSRFFNDSHGKTFFEFVNEYRVRYAKALLKSSDKKLDEIAGLSGFSSRQSLHRVFSKIAGCTPEEYRQLSND